MLISIIVPIYNVENYLTECIESILKQEFDECEIVLVDDGSTDKSGKICDEYAKKYDNVKVIHKKNGGLSDARNEGLKEATGKYILFVDSDDYIGNQSLKKIESSLSKFEYNIDVMFLEAIKVFPDGTRCSMGDGYIAEKINGKSKEKVMQHIAELPKFPGSACTKLIKRELFEKYSIYFEKGLLSEDIEWTVRLLKAANSFAYCDFPYYFYRQGRTGSITNTASRRNIEDILQTIKKWSSKDMTVPYQREINSFMAYEYIVVLFNYAKLNKDNRTELYDEVKKVKWVIKYGISKKERMIRIVTSVFGIRITAWLLKKYKKY